MTLDSAWLDVYSARYARCTTDKIGPGTRELQRRREARPACSDQWADRSHQPLIVETLPGKVVAGGRKSDRAHGAPEELNGESSSRKPIGRPTSKYRQPGRATCMSMKKSTARSASGPSENTKRAMTNCRSGQKIGIHPGGAQAADGPRS